MYRVELYAQVRRSVFVEGLSERAAKRFGLARGTVKMFTPLRRAIGGANRQGEAGLHRIVARLRIRRTDLIDDQERPKKQRHTAKRIFDRLRDEYFTGGYTIVKVRDKKLGGQELVPLVHPPGDAQADFGALVVIDGVQRKAQLGGRSAA